ncbi:MFS transporter [Sphingomonas sp. 10B4]|uniref:MFS transporter n=1 Tax=Sphingomonas sp. 10B4 TaxID=3048575 RepID=UPI002AB3A454|nr:MFS transporter [Sphingomonas sp. 10B4]MDY7526249.1 MFS transporter [Sphingomonas sp. 10B4]MEB0283477.1 MFS transporter [Sphingomonas sp. 10B4]
MAVITGYVAVGSVGALVSTRVPGWMADAGLSAAVIGLTLAASRLGRVVLIPSILHAISARRRIGRGAILLSAATALSLLLPLIKLGNAGWLGVELIAPALIATLMAQLDWLSSTRSASRLDPTSYGSRRAAGSAAFAFTAIICGLPSGTGAINGLMLAGVALMIVSGLAINYGFHDRLSITLSDVTAPTPPSDRASTRWLGIAAFMIQASNGLYSLTPILWAQQGLSPLAIGLLWGVAAASEVGFFMIAPWLCRTIKDWPRALLLLGGGGAVIRWLLIANTASLPLLVVAQTLQSFSFGASLVGTLALIRDRVSGHTQARAVGMNQGIQTGLIPALSLAVSGFLLQALGRQSFVAMAAMAAIGTFAALRARNGSTSTV